MKRFWGRKRGVLLGLIFLVIIFPGFGFADDGSLTPVYKVEEIVVTATRSEANRDTVPANIYIVDREEMEHLPASSAAEVIRHVPGVYVEFNGGLGSQSVASIQGCQVRHVAIYQDGVPLNQLANPMTDLSYLPIGTVERIEIYKGTASSVWGSSLGGVINIVTKEPDPDRIFKADIQTSYGSFNTFKNRGTFSGTVNDLGYLLSLTREESNGFIEHTEYEQDAAYFKLNCRLNEHNKASFVFSHDKGEHADPIIDPPDFWDDVYNRRTYQRLLFETSPADSLVLALEGWHQRFYSRIDDVYPTYIENYFHYGEETWGTGIRANYATHEMNALNIGMDANWGKFGYTGYSDEYNVTNWAGYVNDVLDLEKLSLNGGMRYDHNSDFGSEVSPSGGFACRLLEDDLVIKAQISRGFSAPPGAWVKESNPDLEPERAVNYETGMRISLFDFATAEINLFRSDVKDLIVWEEDNNSPSGWKCFNIDKARRQGMEAAIRADFESGFSLALGGTFVDVKNRNTDEVIKDIPRDVYTSLVSYQRGPVTHSLAGEYIFHNSSYPETRDRQWVFDYMVKAVLPLPETYGRLSAFGAIHNLTNSGYIYRTVFPQPDRWFEGGLNLEF